MQVIIGSARHDENNRYSGGKAGDQTGQEVSTQRFYMHKKGWYAIRAISDELANKIAEGMQIVCDNNRVGYDQGQRFGVYKNGIDSKVDTEGDCSEVVRAILKWCDVFVKDFTTSNEKDVLLNTGLFSCVTINSENECYTGDILVTKTKGHTVVVVKGKARGKYNKGDCPYKEPSVYVTSDANAKERELKAKYVSKGEEVGWNQWYLNKLGYNLGKAGIDCDCGKDTTSAIIQFQMDNGLEVDGISGKDTRKKLKEKGDK